MRSTHIAAIAFLFYSAFALADVNRWTSSGPEGGPVTVVVSDPSNPPVLFAGTAAGGVFKSIDRGSSWKAVNTGLASLTIHALAVDQQTPSTIYAGIEGGDGVVKSIDGGASWKAASTGLTGNRCLALALDPSNASTIYAAMYFGEGDGGVFKSTDAGDSWTLTGLRTLENAMGVLAIDPKNPGTVYAGGAISNGGLFKTTDGGATWSEINNGIPGRGIAALAIDPITPATVYVETFAPGGVFKSINGGGNWSSIGAGLPPFVGFFSSISTFVIDPKNPSILYVGYDSADGVYKSTDGGATWNAASGGLGDAGVSSIAVDGTTSSILYTGTGGGVFESSTGGGNWNAVNKGLTNTEIFSLAIDPLTPTTLYAGTRSTRGFRGVSGSAGVFKSLDSGGTWTAASSGLSGKSIVAIAIDPQNPSILYAGDDFGGFFKSTDGGASWTSPHVSSALQEVETIVIDPETPSTVYVGASEGLFKSTDGGATWASIAGFESRTVSAMAIDPTNSSTIYAGSQDRFGAVALFKSTDGGATWNSINDGLQYANVLSLAIDPRKPSTVYAGTDRAGLFKSEDGGGHWRLASKGLGSLLVTGLAIDPSRPATVYAATRTFVSDSGVFRSGDGGANWAPFNNGLTNLDVPVIAFDPDGTALHIGTNGSGVFDFQLTEATEPCAADPTTLCLNGGRFRVQVSWRALNLGTSGVGQAVPLTSDTGYFWFFSNSNVELVIKAVDGRAFNGYFWVFYGALSDVEYTITVTDTVTGAVKTYFNPQGQLASVADTAAFAATGEAPVQTTSVRSSGASPTRAAVCSSDPTSLCLNGSRFRVQVAWRAVNLGTSGVGQAVSLTSDTGYFWFFSGNNIELVLKVVDGRGFNGHLWVFYGALSDVEYTITVTDTQTGAVKTYFNPQGQLASVADTAAF